MLFTHYIFKIKVLLLYNEGTNFKCTAWWVFLFACAYVAVGQNFSICSTAFLLSPSGQNPSHYTSVTVDEFSLFEFHVNGVDMSYNICSFMLSVEGVLNRPPQDVLLAMWIILSWRHSRSYRLMKHFYFLLKEFKLCALSIINVITRNNSVWPIYTWNRANF